MTFGAMAAWQAWLLLGAAAALAIWIFLRKLRPRRVPIASLILWRRVLAEARELTLWERVRRAVSLVLTAVIALALALAVTRPAPRSHGTTAAGTQTFVVIDSSWSMLTRTGSGESRWDRAMREARRIAAAGAGSEVALATTADGLVAGPTTDVSAITGALNRLTAGGGDIASWPQLAGADSLHFITDGAIPRPLPPDAIVHSVYEEAENVGVTALDVRPTLSGPDGGDAYLEVANFAKSPQAVTLTLTRGTETILERRLNLTAGETLRQLIPLSRGSDAALRAHVDAPRNALRIDDDAYAWIEHARPLSVAVVGQAPGWLRPLFAGDPDVRARFVDPATYTAQAGAATGQSRASDSDGLIVFDRWAPSEVPSIPAILIAPPADTAWLAQATDDRASAPAPELKPRWETVGTHPVLRGVDPVTFIIGSARSYGSSTLTPVAQSTRGTPLVYASESAGRRYVVVAFGPAESNLASAPAFPVLMGNAMDWLVRRETRRARPAGLAAFSNTITSLQGPTGAPVPVARIHGAAVGFLRDPGFYVVEDGGVRSTFAVNIADPLLSNAGHTTLTGTQLTRPSIPMLTARPWWAYCVALALVMALAEWWTWQRRITV
jgi:hypothetical protein